jgi:hypothetical protein
LQNVFFDSCNDEMAQRLSRLQKSEFLKLIILISHFGIFSFFSAQTRLSLNKNYKKYTWVFFPLILCH